MTPGLTVIKCGGTAGVVPSAVCAGVADLARDGHQALLVHGGSADVARLAARLGVRLRDLVTPSGVTTRRTDAETLEVVMLALAGQAKPALLIELARLGVPAVGLTGLDAGLLAARRKAALRAIEHGRNVIVTDDHSGHMRSVGTRLLRLLLDAGIVPVVSPPALAEDGRPVNVNADRVAAMTAAALGAERLVLLTAVPGVLAEPGNLASLLPEYRLPSEADPAIRGGMTIKLVAAGEALRGGVPEVRIADGRTTEAVRLALRGSGGTRVTLGDQTHLWYQRVHGKHSA
jgi:acetylglutamate/LysW-gamma-L-alpha-aminoadipate kinase